jgi:TIR domain/ATPase family associated with various cellular activities (AAA)
MSELDTSTRPIKLFFSYSHKDEQFRDELTKHLAALRRTGVIAEWHDRKIMVGQEWREAINLQINTADLILLLVSADFLVSDFSYSIEMARAMARHEAGEARVVPIILRPCLWEHAPFAKLQALPTGARPVTTWRSSDEAFVSIVKGIRLICEDIRQKSVKARPAVDITLRRIFPVYDVFKPSGVPTVTFVEPDGFNLLQAALAQPGRGVVIEGPSGVGKTTALRTAIKQIHTQIAAYGIEILSARKLNDINRLANLESWHKGIVAIDDFHRLNENLRKKLVDYLKDLADEELEDRKLVIVGIPRTGKKLVNLAFDVALRIQIIELGKVNDETILNMIAKGEEALNIRFERKADIALSSRGSLNIAQFLCYHLAMLENVLETRLVTANIKCDLDMATSKVLKDVALKFEDVVRSFASLGGRRDLTCIEILKELARSDDGFLSFANLKDLRPDLSAGIDRFLEQDYMAVLYNKHPELDNHLFFDGSIPALIIDDPQLMFFLLQIPASDLIKSAGKSLSKRTRVFVSYSHEDSEWLDRIRIHVKPLEREGVVDLWDDTRIKAGTLWKQEIQGAIDSAKVALLLITANFLASDFISDNELPPLLAAAREEGAIILPLIISPSRFMQTPTLSEFQTVNSPQRPLSAITWNEQEELLVKVTQVIEEALTTQ